MGRVRIVIDGYNLIRRIPALLCREHESLEAGREALLDRLFLYKAGKQVEITVVFDGPGRRGFFARGGIRVQFATPADTAVVEMACAGTTVVSSDIEVQNGARRRGAKVMSAEEFWQQVTASIQARRYRGPQKGPRPMFHGTWDKAYIDDEEEERPAKKRRRGRKR
ncbi:MAG: hypothetical protein GX062_00800 [Firmicutes bacterium]|nr:hypothetical protein [Bacillota bacterium]